MLDLLISSYESSVIKNQELHEAQQSLRELNLDLEIALEESKEAKLKAEELSLHDPLTGLANRRFLDIAAANCMARVNRFSSTFSVLMMDIDHFKAYNDTKGHAEGDRILIKAAAVLNNNIRATDLVARYGGEEFVQLMTDSDLNSAVISAERIRLMIAEDLGITISIGVAQYQLGQSFESVVKAADNALYAAKRNGRNRVEVNHNDSNTCKVENR